jgi:hypothetical protein
LSTDFENVAGQNPSIAVEIPPVTTECLMLTRSYSS